MVFSVFFSQKTRFSCFFWPKTAPVAPGFAPEALWVFGPPASGKTSVSDEVGRGRGVAVGFGAVGFALVLVLRCFEFFLVFFLIFFCFFLRFFFFFLKVLVAF